MITLARQYYCTDRPFACDSCHRLMLEGDTAILITLEDNIGNLHWQRECTECSVHPVKPTKVSE
jgi:hypothetical protein